jgi:hypothetical protein
MIQALQIIKNYWQLIIAVGILTFSQISSCQKNNEITKLKNEIKKSQMSQFNVHTESIVEQEEVIKITEESLKQKIEELKVIEDSLASRPTRELTYEEAIIILERFNEE